MGFPVEVKRLVKTFKDEARGEVRAVDGIDFECRVGEVFGLLGANGAGKTTTLRMLSTILSPTSGEAKICGYDIATEPERVRRSIGFYSASTALYPRLSARETIEFFARINQYDEANLRARVDGLVDRLGIASYQNTKVEKLSSGMKQKVSIARTIAHDPPVVIFDEPSVGLDILSTLDLHRVILELRESGKTIILSTHIMSEAEKLCDRIAIMNKGKILACDSLAALREQTRKHYLEDIFVYFVRGEG